MSGRIRSIKPEWIEDERFNACSDAAVRMAKVFYALVDDEGRCRASMRALGLAGWKFCDSVSDKTAHAQGAVTELIAAGWLVGYEAEGYQLWQVRNFQKHQKISHFTESKLPPPPETSAAVATPPDLSGPLRNPPEPAGDLRPDMDRIGSGVGVDPERAREPVGGAPSTAGLIRGAYSELWGQANAAQWPPSQATPEQLRPMVAWFEATAAQERLAVSDVVSRVVRHWAADSWAKKHRYPWVSFAKQYANHWQGGTVATSPAERLGALRERGWASLSAAERTEFQELVGQGADA
jgi:hypothetical protein